MQEFLGHPLLILVTGALLSGWVIPRVTRGWHTQQKALEIKTDLVTELSKSIMEMITAIQYARLGTVSQTQADFDNAFRTWEVDSSVIGTKLHAYFPETAIPGIWTNCTERIRDFYAIEGVSNEEKRKFELELWEKLRQQGPLPEGDAGWLELKNALLRKKAHILQSILGEHISVLN